MKQLKEGQTTIMRNQRALGYISSKLAHRATWILGALITISITINVFMYVQWNTRSDEVSSGLIRYQAYQAMDSQHKHDALLAEMGEVQKSRYPDNRPHPKVHDILSDSPEKMRIEFAVMNRYVEEHGIKAWEALAKELNRFHPKKYEQDASAANAHQ